MALKSGVESGRGGVTAAIISARGLSRGVPSIRGTFGGRRRVLQVTVPHRRVMAHAVKAAVGLCSGRMAVTYYESNWSRAISH